MKQPTQELAHGARFELLLIQTGAHLRERFARAYDWLTGLRRVHRQRLRRRARMSLAMLALLIATSGVPLPAHAASIIVAPGAARFQNGDGCSLAEAIVNANNDAATWNDCPAGSGADTITMPSGTILNYSVVLGPDTALPEVTSQITIEGMGSIIHRTGGGGPHRLISVAPAGNLTLNRVTLNNGDCPNGGAIRNTGILTVKNSTLSGNTAQYGGGIESAGTLTVLHSTISGNTVSSFGGGIMQNGGTATVTNSTISGNSAELGGGIYSAGDSFTATNSTITGNAATIYGGGLYSNATVATLNRVIVSGNSAMDLGNEIKKSGGTITANNLNLFGHSGVNNANAFSNFTPGATDITATSDGTQPTALTSILNTTLANNGGPTWTHNLVSSSPALDRATGDACQAAPVSGLDQRYKVRAPGASTTCDIGAVEFNAPTAVTLSQFNAQPQPFDLGAWFKQLLGLAR